MELIQAMHNVITNKEEGGVQGYLDVEAILKSLDMDDFRFEYWGHWKDQDALEVWFLVPFFDTDTYTGISVLLFHGQPMALLTKPSRKTDLQVEWIGKWQANMVKNYLESFMTEEEEFEPDCIENLTEFFPDSYKITFTSQVLNKKGLFDGKKVEVTQRKAGEKATYINNNLFVSSKEGVKIPTTTDKVQFLTLVRNNPLEG